ncbi:MAG: NUDIX domain-containing protein [Patescibacteria group bacterium]|nr:NUDIX domain-containing protein [Patescibacteria group bacterium]
MIAPSLTQIDSTRVDGFRPQVVGCFVHAKKIFMFHEEKYDLWQLPQGGIENKETIEQAVEREMTEELGKNFFSFAIKSYTLMGSNSVKFPPEHRGSRELKMDDGQEIEMRGKWYYFISIQTAADKLAIEESDFDTFKLLSHKEAIELADSIYQKGKKRVTLLAIDLLKQNNIIQ